MAPSEILLLDPTKPAGVINDIVVTPLASGVNCAVPEDVPGAMVTGELTFPTAELLFNSATCKGAAPARSACEVE